MVHLGLKFTQLGRLEKISYQKDKMTIILWTSAHLLLCRFEVTLKSEGFQTEYIRYHPSVNSKNIISSQGCKNKISIASTNYLFPENFILGVCEITFNFGVGNFCLFVLLLHKLILQQYLHYQSGVLESGYFKTNFLPFDI